MLYNYNQQLSGTVITIIIIKKAYSIYSQLTDYNNLPSVMDST